MSSAESWKWIDEVMVASFPLGILKDVGEKKDAD